MINKIRMIDVRLKRQIGRKSLHFCEKHYPEKNLYDASIKLYLFYDCSNLFLQKAIVNLRKFFTEMCLVILHQQPLFFESIFSYLVSVIFRCLIFRYHLDYSGSWNCANIKFTIENYSFDEVSSLQIIFKESSFPLNIVSK